MTKRTLTLIESRNENLPIINDFAAAAKRHHWAFHNLENINSDNISRYDLDDLPLDFVIYRALSNNYAEVQRLLQWLDQHHKITINCNVHGGYATCSDKHFQHGLFMLDPLLQPYVLPTFEAKNKTNVISYVRNGRVHFPLVLKERNGSTGKNITLIRSAADLDGVKNFDNLIIEQYIEPECDYRVFVVGGVAIGTVRKYGDPEHPENFQIWSAGERKYLETNATDLDILSEIATRAAAASHSELSGIDIVRERGTNHFYVLENNIAAGWLNLTPDTMIDVPSAVIDWLADCADGREQPFHIALKTYLNHRLPYLPPRIQKSCSDIQNGVPDTLEPYRHIFATYPDRYLTDAGNIFNRLSRAYRECTTKPASYFEIQPSRLDQILHLLTELESLPFSWAGNFIGPEVGTFHDGAILSALYLYLHYKLIVKNRQN